MSENQAGRVRTPFRILAYIVGPVSLLAGVWGLGDSLYVWVTEGWPAFRANHETTSMGALGVLFGIMFLRAAISGWDPNVPRDE